MATEQLTPTSETSKATEQTMLEIWRILPEDYQQQALNFLRFLVHQLGLVSLAPAPSAQDEFSPPEPSESSQGLSRFIGAAKGNYKSVEEIDQFIRQERDAWKF